MRKLASIQRIKEIKPIEGANVIELAKVLGWQCVVGKGIFKENDLCVYFEIDSFLPTNDTRYDFLRLKALKKHPVLGEGILIRTLKIRGELSQGLIMPLSEFPEITQVEEGLDLTNLLNVQKYELPESDDSSFSGFGYVKYKGLPFFVSQTDETRVQSEEKYIQKMQGKPYYITTKLDGASHTIAMQDGQLYLTSRNNTFDTEKESLLKQVLKRNGALEKILNYKDNIIIQGELCGPGIQKNRLKLDKLEYFVFNIIVDNGLTFCKWDKMQEIAKELNLQTVPLEEKGNSFSYQSVEELVERAKGTNKNGTIKEGIVIRDNMEDLKITERISFKVINNDYLLKE